MPSFLVTKLLCAIVNHLDIPKSYYEKARARHRSLGDWLCRPESRIAQFNPHVSPQGSFQYGTVNRPLVVGGEYDLDNVTTLEIPKTLMTQRQLKELHGAEVKGYALAHGMIRPVEEKNRCWRLHYEDDVAFHLDTLPCVPAEQRIIQAIVARNVPRPLAELVVAITDKRHPEYDKLTGTMLTSNPRGFARWFEDRARSSASDRLRKLVELRIYASVEDVPTFEWKTPLQQSIQILKRHRDVMFRDDPRSQPISMIITNLAARAYNGETDLGLALSAVVENMARYVQATAPRVPNPADPAEDYADKWARNPDLEQNFWAWLTQVRIDIARLATLLQGSKLASEVRRIFGVEFTSEELQEFEGNRVPRANVVRSPVLSIPSAPKPWGFNE